MTSSINEPDNSNLLDTKQAAEYLGLRPSTLRTWRYKKSYDLKYMKIGRAVIYRLEDLSIFLESHNIYKGRCQKTYTWEEVKIANGL